MNSEQIRIACATDATTAARWLAPLAATFHQYNIDTPLRQAAFLAQAGYESGGLITLEENLNYSANGLLRVFRKYFDNALALKYQRNPVAIANRVYANRLGNGDESSGDGWKYRGRGIFQVTGHDNYLMVENALGIPCVDNPDLLLQKKNAADSAAVFWVKHGLQELADKGDIDGITARINKYTDSYQKRKDRYLAARKAFGI